jgi:hypothetical protein
MFPTCGRIPWKAPTDPCLEVLKKIIMPWRQRMGNYALE